MRGRRRCGFARRHPARCPIGALALAAACAVLAACTQGPPPDALQEGQEFPPLVLSGFDGRHLALDDLRGKLVVLNVWATWCAPCRRELPSLGRLQRALDPQRFAFVGLSVDDDPQLAQEYLRERGVPFASYIDRGGALARAQLGIRVYPDTFVISPHGALLRHIAGERDWDDPRMRVALEAAYRGDAAALRGL